MNVGVRTGGQITTQETEMAKQTEQLWIGNQARPEDRTIIAVRPEHAQEIRSLAWGADARVYDTNGKRWVRLRQAECGLPGCRCALAFVPRENHQ